MQELNMKQIIQNIMTNHPYQVIKDGLDPHQSASEITKYTDISTFSIYRVGKNFQKLPFPKPRGYGMPPIITVDFVDIYGNISETVSSSQYDNLIFSEKLYFNEKAEFDFTGDDDTIIAALIFHETTSLGKETAILFLSKPHTMALIRSKRKQTLLKKNMLNSIENEIKILQEHFA